jgi:hypothetical protein
MDDITDTFDANAADWLTDGNVTAPFGRLERRMNPPLAGFWLISHEGAHGPFVDAEAARRWARRPRRAGRGVH